MTITTEQLERGLRDERDLGRISGQLQAIAANRFDVVAPARALNCKGTPHSLMISFGQPQITASGVVGPDLECGYTRTAWRQIAERLHIPLAYLDRLVGMDNPVGPMLACQNVSDLAFADGRSALYRFVNTDDGYVLRALLSDRYQAIDNDLALGAIVEGLSANELHLGECEVSGDVTPDRFRLRITVPQVAHAVPDLLGDYRMPFSMRPGNPLHAVADPDERPPVLWAGVEITNSETGQGAFAVRPRAVIAVCRNGLTRDVEFRRAHIGAVLDHGQVQWSNETIDRALALITSQVRDAVATYISPTYLMGVADEMRRAKGVAVDDTAAAVEVVTERFGLNEQQRNTVFELFASGGDRTALGLANAVGAAAQLEPSGDDQATMEARFWEIVERPQAFVGAGA